LEDIAAGTEFWFREITAAEGTYNRFFFDNFFPAERTFSHNFLKKKKGTGYFME
jgi:hypothetical protein